VIIDNLLLFINHAFQTCFVSTHLFMDVSTLYFVQWTSIDYITLYLKSNVSLHQIQIANNLSAILIKRHNEIVNNLSLTYLHPCIHLIVQTYRNSHKYRLKVELSQCICTDYPLKCPVFIVQSSSAGNSLDNNFI